MLTTQDIPGSRCGASDWRPRASCCDPHGNPRWTPCAVSRCGASMTPPRCPSRCRGQTFRHRCASAGPSSSYSGAGQGSPRKVGVCRSRCVWTGRWWACRTWRPRTGSSSGSSRPVPGWVGTTRVRASAPRCVRPCCIWPSRPWEPAGPSRTPSRTMQHRSRCRAGSATSRTGRGSLIAGVSARDRSAWRSRRTVGSPHQRQRCR